MLIVKDPVAMKPTPKPLNQYHVFLASPGDVGVERQLVRKFFDDYNRHIAHIWNARFEVVDWENYASTGVGRPQELITQQTLDKYRGSLALVIGIMAQRFGSPSGKEESGTEEEFNWAMESHKTRGFPEIKWFFRKVDKLELPSDPDEADAALDQWKKVRAFRKRMQDLKDPVFCAEYPNSTGFTEVFQRDLRLWLADPSRPWAAEREAQIPATDGATTVTLPTEFDAEQYRTAVLKRFDRLNFEMLDTTGAFYNAVRLWSVFVAQSVRESHEFNPRLLEIPKEHQKRLLNSGEMTARELKDAEMQADRLRQQYFQQPLRPVLEVIDEAFRAVAAGSARKLVLLGDPGSGKSSLIRYLAVRWAGISESAVRDTQPIPLVVELGAYSRWRCDRGKDFIRFLEEAPGWYQWSAGLLGKLVAQHARVILLLDGLDEVFDMKLRAEVVDDIQRFSSKFPHLHILVTSRVVGYQAQRLRDAEFRHFMLQDLDDTQITDFLQRWHEVTFDDPAQAGPKRDRLQKAIRESKSIALLAGNPLLLTMMAILNRNQELPRDRADLYAQASRVLLHQWETERALEAFPGISVDIGPREKSDLLRRIAAHMQAAPGGLKGNLIDGPTLTRLIEGYLQEELHIAQSRAVARAVVEQLRLRNFILCFMGADSYAFIHRTFLEYFCAADFVHQFNVSKTLEIDGLMTLFGQHYRDDEWREVLRLICGQIDEQFVGRIVEWLARRTDLDKWDGSTELPELPLAIWCLSETRNATRLQNEGSLLLGVVMQFLVDCDGEIPQEDTSSYGHSVLQDFIDEALMPPILALSGRWPGANHFEQDAVALVEKLKGGGLESWSKFVANVLNDRKVVERLTESSRFQVRAGAIEELMTRPAWANESTSPRLRMVATKDVNGYTRIAAIRGLVNSWSDEDTKGFITEISVSDPLAWVRRGTLQAIAEKWPDQTTRELLTRRAVQEDDTDPRRAALVILAKKWPDLTTREFLTQRALEDQDASPRRVALEALADNWPDQATRDLLTQRAVQDDDEFTRRGALMRLADNWPDQVTRDLLTQRAVQEDNSEPRRAALEVLTKKWPDQTTRDLLAQRVLDAPERSERGEVFSRLGEMHSRFGGILPTRDLDGVGPYLDPMKPIPRKHIEKAAAVAGIRPGDIDATIGSLSAHLGWDITLGAKSKARSNQL